MRRNGVEPQRVVMPCYLPIDAGYNSGGEIGGDIVLERRFGKPTNLKGKRVELVIEEMAKPITVKLNGESLIIANRTPFRFDVTALLLDRNLLVLSIKDYILNLTFVDSGSSFGPFNEVRLEITEALAPLEKYET